MKKSWTRSLREEEGQDSTEYALMLAMICVVLIAVLQLLGFSLHKSYSNATSIVAGVSAHSPANAPASSNFATAGGSGSPGEPAAGGGGYSSSGGFGSGHGHGHGHGKGYGNSHGHGNGHAASGNGRGGGGGNPSGPNKTHLNNHGSLGGSHKR